MADFDPTTVPAPRLPTGATAAETLAYQQLLSTWQIMQANWAQHTQAQAGATLIRTTISDGAAATRELTAAQKDLLAVQREGIELQRQYFAAITANVPAAASGLSEDFTLKAMAIAAHEHPAST